MTADVVVQIQGLSKKYDNRAAVNSIDLSIFRGECFGLLGPNGAGKTTTLRMILGSTPPSSGSLSVLGFDVPANAREMRAQIGVVPQHDNLDPDFTVAENLRIYGRYFRLHSDVLEARIKRLLVFAALEAKANAGIGTLSGGMRRRLILARALINDPALLILDEPTTGLDPQARQYIWRQLRSLLSEGKTIILTTHYMEEAERLCSRLAVMDNGRIVGAGSPTELIQQQIEPHVIEVHGLGLDEWHEECGKPFALRSERAGETFFYYAKDERLLIEALKKKPQLHFLHRRGNLEDVFIKLTGKELRDR